MAKKFNSAEEYMFAQSLENNFNSITNLRNDYNAFTKSGSMKETYFNSMLSLLDAWGFGLSDIKYQSVSKEDKKLIRFEFYGIVDKVKDPKHKLTKIYQNAKSRKVGSFGIDDYQDLSEMPIWQTCEQSEKFRAIKPRIIEHLQSNSISPQILPFLEMYDFQDILFEAYKPMEKVNSCDVRAYFMQGRKEDFVKYFSIKHEAQIREILGYYKANNGVVDNLLEVMQNFGTTDVVMKNGRGLLMPVHDYKIEIHHNDAVAHADKRNACIFDVNRPEKLTAVINSNDFPLHKILHLFDRVAYCSKDKTEQMAQKMLVPKNTAFILGVDPLFMIKDSCSDFYKQKESGLMLPAKGGRNEPSL